MKRKTGLFLMLLSALVGCEDLSTLNVFLDSKPVARAGMCEIYTLGLTSENRALQAKEDLITSLTTWSAENDKIHSVKDSQVFPYASCPSKEDDSVNCTKEQRGYKEDNAWAAWVEYGCNGSPISSLITAPVSINQAEAKINEVLDTLQRSGYVVLDVARYEIFSDEGIYVSFTVHYYIEERTAQPKNFYSAKELSVMESKLEGLNKIIEGHITKQAKKFKFKVRRKDG